MNNNQKYRGRFLPGLASCRYVGRCAGIWTLFITVKNFLLIKGMYLHSSQQIPSLAPVPGHGAELLGNLIIGELSPKVPKRGHKSGCVRREEEAHKEFKIRKAQFGMCQCVYVWKEDKQVVIELPPPAGRQLWFLGAVPPKPQRYLGRESYPAAIDATIH